ncbi:MAG: hypothetical protein ACRC1P_09570 [Cellulosilyticaceae bacterium]
MSISNYYVMNDESEEKVLITKEQAEDKLGECGVYSLESYLSCFGEDELEINANKYGLIMGGVYLPHNSVVPIITDTFDDLVSEDDINKLLTRELVLCDYVNELISVVALNIMRNELENMMNDVNQRISDSDSKE